jgi:hypothetical protein
MIIVATSGETGPIIVGHARDLVGLRYATQGEEFRLLRKLRSNDIDAIRQRLARRPHRLSVVFQRSPELLGEVDELGAESWRGRSRSVSDISYVFTGRW